MASKQSNSTELELDRDRLASSRRYGRDQDSSRSQQIERDKDRGFESSGYGRQDFVRNQKFGREQAPRGGQEEGGYGSSDRPDEGNVDHIQDRGYRSQPFSEFDDVTPRSPQELDRHDGRQNGRSSPGRRQH